MSTWETAKDNWRVVLLVFMLVLSSLFLFAPAFEPSGSEGPAAQETATNLQYGLELSGGSRIRAPLVGVTAEEVQFGGDDTAEVEREVAAELETGDSSDVIARFSTNTSGTVELVSENATQSDLRDALDAAGYEYETVRDGVTDETRQQTIEVLESKINAAGLSGGTVRTIGDGDFVLIEVPNDDLSEVRDLVNSRGTVQIAAYHQVQRNNTTEYVNTTVIRQEDFQTVGTAQQGGQGPGPHVPVSVRQSEAERVQDQFVETGVAGQGGTECTYSDDPQSTEPCILIIRDGSVVSSFGMDPSLAQSMRNGEWAQDPQFILVTGSFERAQQVSVDLRAGALPAGLALDEGTATAISAAQGEDFKRDSLIIGLLAVFTVAGVVFFRYGDPKVAAPMVVTAFSEVVVLLGFAAFIQYPLDLSVIAGFIAVIGTGVDDLVIIADEVMAEGDVNSRRVFRSRFRKAFWVVGAAAATTIVAMAPLASPWLSLGDLQGFAIFTILGVLVGVLITRPAYGDILRALLTDR
ncbi:preprotein translocase subunit SecD [Halobaculum magnesiiphilum]|uniref:Protein-export membrane protein SecD n=1 Tax=Halobaculum magnesiiphilum TaxID=1017351 RepID=A0A8T8WGL3_9EURY|nr:preprotein translocase subunit SecD [Halobaculum magnesiiphilum]QZP38970.1 preprotein translocase subunit SecD [Halobaculum magnesiiphilum]